jgi:Fanconi anemia group M protein
LITRNTRDESYYWAAYHKEKKMYGILEDMQQGFKKQLHEKNQKKLGSF